MKNQIIPFSIMIRLRNKKNWVFWKTYQVYIYIYESFGENTNVEVTNEYINKIVIIIVFELEEYLNKAIELVFLKI